MKGRGLGIDIGGTNIKVGHIVDGVLVEKSVFPTEADKGKEKVLKVLLDIISNYNNEIDFVGLAVAGLVDHKKGIVYEPPNLPGWFEVDLKQIIESETKRRCFVLNDANAFAIGEWQFGSGIGSENLIGVTLGTGVGGGVIVNGTLLLGSVHFAAEIGHMVIDPTGPDCNCGQRGCWEAFLGNGYFASRAKSVFIKYGVVIDDYSPEVIFKYAKEGFEPAIWLWKEYGYFLGIGLVNLIHLFDPEVIVIGGGISNAFELFIDSARKTIKERVMGFSRRNLEIKPSILLEDASILGAYYFALRDGKVG